MAAVDMFLKLDGIKGESQDAKHAGEIHIESYSLGMINSVSTSTGGGLGAGKVRVHDIHITKFVDKSSPALMAHVASGKHIPSGLITLRKAGDKPLEYLKIKLQDVIVASHQVAGSASSHTQVSENITLNFAKIWVEYQEQKADGSGAPGGEMGWDVKANQKL